jgi:acetolactate synthase-1/2/3 large subunit
VGNEIKKTKADLIAKFMADNYVPAVFELSGGMIVFITDAIHRLGITKIIGLRHEQSAGFAAEAATRFSGIPNVAMATSGPGATNLITSIASSYFDSVPTIFITGQVNQNELRKNKKQRQHGFQELDIVSMVSEITKYSKLINSDDDIVSVLKKSWRIATSDRPGPVLIDIPIDVQQEYVEIEGNLKVENEFKIEKVMHANQINELKSLLAGAERPIILAGGGIRTSGSTKKFERFVNQLKIPVVHSLMGIDSLGSENIYKIGMIGSYGNRWANEALLKSDLVLSIGSRLDVRQIGSDKNNFLKDKKLIRVETDAEELNSGITSDLDLECSIKNFLESTDYLDSPSNYDSWLKQIRTMQKNFPQINEQNKTLKINPNELLQQLSVSIKDIAAFIVDVGQHQMWSAQSLEISRNSRFLTSGGLGAMGFAIPALIGCATTNTGNFVAILGDGCAQLSMNELQTIKENNLNVVVIILNNNQHGMVSQFQEVNVSGRYILTREGYSTPNFTEISKVIGIRSIKVTKKRQIKKVVKMINNKKESLLIEIEISQEARALPKMQW